MAKELKGAQKRKGLTGEELAAMKARLKELNMKSGGEEAIAATIAKVPEPDESMAKKLHAIIRANAPGAQSEPIYGLLYPEVHWVVYITFVAVPSLLLPE